jgi:hypothetical protein
MFRHDFKTWLLPPHLEATWAEASWAAPQWDDKAWGDEAVPRHAEPYGIATRWKPWSAPVPTAQRRWHPETASDPFDNTQVAVKDTRTEPQQDNQLDLQATKEVVEERVKSTEIGVSVPDQPKPGVVANEQHVVVQPAASEESDKAQPPIVATAAVAKELGELKEPVEPSGLGLIGLLAKEPVEPPGLGLPAPRHQPSGVVAAAEPAPQDNSLSGDQLQDIERKRAVALERKAQNPATSKSKHTVAADTRGIAISNAVNELPTTAVITQTLGTRIIGVNDTKSVAEVGRIRTKHRR